MDPRNGDRVWALDLGAALARGDKDDDDDSDSDEDYATVAVRGAKVVAPPTLLRLSEDVVFAYVASYDRILVVDVGSGTVDKIFRVREGDGAVADDEDVDEDKDEPSGGDGDGPGGGEVGGGELSLAERKEGALARIRERKRLQRERGLVGNNPVAPHIEIHAEMLLTPPRKRQRQPQPQKATMDAAKAGGALDEGAWLHQRVLLVGTIKTGLHAYSLDDRVPTALAPLWRYPAAGMVDFQSPPSYCPRRDLVLIGGFSGALHALNGSTG